jgi:hypothetical protein
MNTIIVLAGVTVIAIVGAIWVTYLDKEPKKEK